MPRNWARYWEHLWDLGVDFDDFGPKGQAYLIDQGYITDYGEELYLHNPRKKGDRREDYGDIVEYEMDYHDYFDGEFDY